MKKVYQSIVCKERGDCCRAVMASLFDKELHEVPEFKPDHNQGLEISNFLEEHGYEYGYYNKRDGQTTQDGAPLPTLLEVAKYDGGINGYFYASVKSQTFDGVTHAVVVDIDLNIVHDPNPNQLAMQLGPDDVQGLIVVKDWYVGRDGNFVDR